MIVFTTPIYDADGSRVFKEDKAKTRLDQPETRASRDKCLDGTVAIGNYGVVDGDRTFSIAVPNVSVDEYEFMKRLQKDFSSAICSCREGVFSGIIKSLPLSQGIMTVKFWVGERLDE